MAESASLAPQDGGPSGASARGRQQLVGRGPEVAALRASLCRPGGEGHALLVRGEPGIGKSALLADAARHAAGRGLRVLRTSGVEAEAQLPFAGLHKLLRPVLDGIDGLAGVQRDAMRCALGLAAGPPPDPFHIGLAALELLTEHAARRPFLLVLDDVHWLDRPTVDALTFVARRVESDPITLLAAARDGHASSLYETGLPELRVLPLDDDAAAELLDAHAPGLETAVRARLLEEAAGNPLALVELSLVAEQVGGGTLLPAWLPLTTRLEQAFAARVSGLPPETRTLLLVAALNDAEAPGEVLDAASLVMGTTLTLQDLAPAIGTLLVELDDAGLRFRHPLVRSAIRQAASLAQRHVAHAALAEVLAAEPDRRVWHRAAARLRPDDDIAADLEAAAARARQRGGIGVAVAALERAAQLTADPARRGRQLLDAAELAGQMGRHDVVVALLDEAERLALEDVERGRLLWLREVLDDHLWTGAEQVQASVARAERMQDDGDTARALDFLQTAASKCWRFNAGPEPRALVVAAAQRLPVPADHPKRLMVLALATPLEEAAGVTERLLDAAPRASGDLEALLLVGTALTAHGAFGPGAVLLRAAIEDLRARGQLGLLARALVSQAWSAIYLGRWSEALSAAEEAGRLACETAQPRWATAAGISTATVMGLRGEPGAEALAAEAEAVLLPTGAQFMLALVQIARGTAALGAGRHADAYAHLRRLFDPADVAHHPHARLWALPDLVEAAVRSGHGAEARTVLAEVEALDARPAPGVVRIGIAAARALLADDDEAERRFAAALAEDLSGWPFVRARLLLAQGAGLRRRRRVAESRGPLRAAREAFDALGASPWAARARQELRASGETSRRRTRDVLEQLTPQELQVATMAAAGLSNREIGEKLFLSHRTVGSHLYRTFPKLGITSRADLPAALGAARLLDPARQPTGKAID